MEEFSLHYDGMGTGNPAGVASPQSLKTIAFGEKYQLIERIAVGGMAEVFLSKSFGIEGFEKIIAIKRILPTMAEDQDFIDMFVDEAKIAGQLTHGNIVPIYELGKVGDAHYIAMEYVWGKDLLQIMNRFRRMRKRMPAAMVGFIGSKMCEALEYAHTKRDRSGKPLGLIHRDISPQNVLVSYDGAIKLIDFGIAKAASRTTKTQAGVLKGKFGYMSPEQVRGVPLDHRSDLFAVGTCMYEMLVSDRLFVGESDFSTLEKVRHAEVTPPSHVVRDVPPELEKIIMRALTRDREDRFSSAAEMQEALQEFVALNRPPFTTAKLSTWMKGAFQKEMEEEKTKLDAYSAIPRPTRGASIRVKAPPAPAHIPPNATLRPRPPIDKNAPPEDFAAEATTVSNTPFDFISPDGLRVQDLEEVSPEPTQIFFSAEDDAEAERETRHGLRDPGPNRPAFAPPANPKLPTPPAQGLTPKPYRPPAPPPVRPAQMPPQAQEIPAAQHQLVAGEATVASAVTEPSSVPPPVLGGAALDESVETATDSNDSNEFPMTTSDVLTTPLGPTDDARPAQPAFVSPPGMQRSMPTLEMHALSEPPPPKSRKGLWLGLAAAALAAGVAVALWVSRPGPVGSLQVSAMPRAEATLYLDGEARGLLPQTLAEVSEGPHVLRVEASGYVPQSREITVAAGSVVILEIALQSAPSNVNAATPPSEATDAPPEQQQRQAEPAQRQAEPAQQQAEPAQRQAEPAQRQAEPAQREARVGMEAARPPRGRGTLVVNSLPWSAVFVDGQRRGNTPLPSLALPAGAHQVELRTSDGRTHRVPVTIEAGETARVVHQF